MQLLCRDKAASRGVNTMEALSLSSLNMASIQVFVKNTVGSLDRLTSRRAVDTLSSLAGLLSWTSSSRTGLTTSGARVETRA